MKRFLSKLGRFFWSRGFLKFVLWSITIVILLYVEEDWRGARAWAATKAEWEAKGESFDFNKFIPPPIPDDQNLASIPLFKVEKVGVSDYEPLALNQAMHSDSLGFGPPSRGNWMRGELPDMAKIQSAIATDYSMAFKGVTPPEDALAQFNALYPFIPDLLAASATRPLYRFDLDYSIIPPDTRSFGPLIISGSLSKVLNLHASLALDHHQPDLAMEDIQTNYKLIRGAANDPTIVGGLVAIGVAALTNGAIYDGLARHAWDDHQLVEIDRILASINFLADFQFDFKGEAVATMLDIDYYKHANRQDILGLLGGMSDPAVPPIVPLLSKIAPPWPNGWWDCNKARITALHFQQLATVDPQARRVFPGLNIELRQQTEQAHIRWDAGAPWNIWFSLTAPPLTNLTIKYAYAQVWTDEIRIACALERYHLAHGVYPDSLDVLAPTYLDKVPHDIMNGDPYNYRPHPDGTFLLYSVGWNQTDEGGKVVPQKDDVKKIDYTEGDWAWPTPLAQPAAAPR